MKLRTLLTLLLILLILRKMKRKKYHQKLRRKRLNRILLKADGKIYSPFETSAQIIFVPEALRTSRTRVSGASMPRTTPSTLSSTTRCSWCTSSSAGSAANQSIGSTTGCTITEKAPRAFSWFKAPHSVSECGFQVPKTYQAAAHIWSLPR